MDIKRVIKYLSVFVVLLFAQGVFSECVGKIYDVKTEPAQLVVGEQAYLVVAYEINCPSPDPGFLGIGKDLGWSIDIDDVIIDGRYGPMGLTSKSVEENHFTKWIDSGILRIPFVPSSTGTYTITVRLQKIKNNWPDVTLDSKTITVTVTQATIKEIQTTTPTGVCNGTINSIKLTKTEFTTEENPSAILNVQYDCIDSRGVFIIATIGDKSYRYGSQGIGSPSSSLYFAEKAFIGNIIITWPERLPAGTYTWTFELKADLPYQFDKVLDKKSTTFSVKEVVVQPEPIPAEQTKVYTCTGSPTVLEATWSVSNTVINTPVQGIIRLKNPMSGCYFSDTLYIFIYRDTTKVETATIQFRLEAGETKEYTFSFVPRDTGTYKYRVVHAGNVLKESTSLVVGTGTVVTPPTGCALDVTKVEVPTNVSAGSKFNIRVHYALNCPQPPENLNGVYFKISYADKSYKYGTVGGLVPDSALYNTYIPLTDLAGKTFIDIPNLDAPLEPGKYRIDVTPYFNLKSATDQPAGISNSTYIEVIGGVKPGVPIQIVEYGFYDAQGRKISQIPVETPFQFCAVITAIDDAIGTLKIELKPDIPLWFDPSLSVKTFDVRLYKGETRKYCIEYTAKTEVVLATTKYHADIYWNDIHLGRFPENPANDLVVIVPKPGETITVVSHGWKDTTGKEITSTWEPQAYVYITLRNNLNTSYTVSVLFKIKEDLPLQFDSVVDTISVTEELPPMTEKEISAIVTFPQDGMYHYEIYVNGEAVVKRGKSLSVGLVGWLTGLTTSLTGKALPYVILGIGILVVLMILLYMFQPFLLLMLYRQMIMMELFRRMFGRE